MSDYFDQMSLLERHKKIYALLDVEIKEIHALSLKLYTLSEWKKDQAVPKSPPCSSS